MKIDKNGRIHDERGRFITLKGRTQEEVERILGETGVITGRAQLNKRGKRRVKRIWREFEMKRPLFVTKGRAMKRMFCHSYLFVCKVKKDYKPPVWMPLIDEVEDGEIIEHEYRISSMRPELSDEEIVNAHNTSFPEHSVITFSYLERKKMEV